MYQSHKHKIYQNWKAGNFLSFKDTLYLILFSFIGIETNWNHSNSSSLKKKKKKHRLHLFCSSSRTTLFLLKSIFKYPIIPSNLYSCDLQIPQIHKPHLCVFLPYPDVFIWPLTSYVFNSQKWHNRIGDLTIAKKWFLLHIRFQLQARSDLLRETGCCFCLSGYIR